MNKNHGFTLVELLITVVVLAILTALAVPSFRELMDRNAVATTANNLLSSILLARSESIKMETPVIFSGTAGFSTWQVAADTDRNGTGDLILMEHNRGGNNVNVSADGDATITFNTRGRTTSDATGNSFTITKNNATRCVRFSASGRPRVQEGECP